MADRPKPLVDPFGREIPATDGRESYGLARGLRPAPREVMPEAGPRMIARTKRCQNCRHFRSAVDDSDFLTHYTILTSTLRAFRPDAAWPLWDTQAKRGEIGACRIGKSKGDLIHAMGLCDDGRGNSAWEARFVPEGGGDLLGAEARELLGDPPEAIPPKAS